MRLLVSKWHQPLWRLTGRVILPYWRHTFRVSKFRVSELQHRKFTVFIFHCRIYKRCLIMKKELDINWSCQERPWENNIRRSICSLLRDVNSHTDKHWTTSTLLLSYHLPIFAMSSYLITGASRGLGVSATFFIIFMWNITQVLIFLSSNFLKSLPRTRKTHLLV